MDRFILQRLELQNDTPVIEHVGFYDTLDSARLHAKFILSVDLDADLKLFFGDEAADWDDEGVTTLELE